MPRFYKQGIPYILNDELVIPHAADECFRFWTWDWEGKYGANIHSLLRGLDREDLIPEYTFLTKGKKLQPVVSHLIPVRRAEGKLF